MALCRKLPIEIIHQIAQCSSLSVADLASLVRVSKFLHDAVLPLLYREVRFGGLEKETFPIFARGKKRRPEIQPFALFVLTTLLNPRIAALVQSLDVSQDAQQSGRNGPAWRRRLAVQHGEQDSVRDVIADRLEELFSNEKLQSRWHGQIVGQQMSTIVAFGLSLLPNLRALSIALQKHDLESTFAQIVSCRRRKPAMAPQFLARLEYLRFNASDGAWVFRDIPGTVRTLPALQYLSMSLSEDSIEQCFKHVSLSGLRYASFDDPFCLPESRLREFVQNSGQLNHLEFQMRSCWPISKYNTMGSTLISLLSQHCPNLKVLSILDQPCGDSSTRCGFASKLMERRMQAHDLAALDLRPLRNLRKVHVGIAFIHDKIEGKCLAEVLSWSGESYEVSEETATATLSDLLPSSIEEVVLTSCDFDHDSLLNQTLIALLRYKDQRQPKLTSVSFTNRDAPGESDTSRAWDPHPYQGIDAGGAALSEARNLAREVGVHFGRPFELWGRNRRNSLLGVINDLKSLPLMPTVPGNFTSGPARYRF